MSAKKDYIPQNNAEFNRWLDNLVEYVKRKTDNNSREWTHIPTAAASDLEGERNDWRTHYEPTLGAHTPAQTRGRNDQRKQAEKFVRPFVQRYLMWPPVTDEDRVNMEIHNRDTIRTSHPAPALRPNTLVENTLNHFEHKAVAVNPGTGTPKKPDGVHGVRYAWQVGSPAAAGGEKPAGGDYLLHDKFTLKTHYVITHNEADKGKTVYVASCYENAKGDKGPWSEIAEGVIG